MSGADANNLQVGSRFPEQLVPGRTGRNRPRPSLGDAQQVTYGFYSAQCKRPSPG